jgi:hypothetical protein
MTDQTVDRDEFGVYFMAAVALYLRQAAVRMLVRSDSSIDETWKKYSKPSEAGTRSVIFSNSALIDSNKR